VAALGKQYNCRDGRTEKTENKIPKIKTKHPPGINWDKPTENLLGTSEPLTGGPFLVPSEFDATPRISIEIPNGEYNVTTPWNSTAR
jgi:hypothetical protein